MRAALGVRPPRVMAAAAAMPTVSMLGSLVVVGARVALHATAASDRPPKGPGAQAAASRPAPTPAAIASLRGPARGTTAIEVVSRFLRSVLGGFVSRSRHIGEIGDGIETNCHPARRESDHFRHRVRRPA